VAARAATVSPARAAAFDVLLRVFEDDAYADRALRTAAASLDERDRALAQRLAYGAVQRVRTLDYAIEELGGRRVARLDAPGLIASNSIYLHAVRFAQIRSAWGGGAPTAAVRQTPA